jgi:hypothetical protein
MTLNSALALFGTAQARLTTPWAKRLEKSHLLNPAFVADCLSRFTILSQSLRNAQPLPLTIPILDRMAYHVDRRKRLQRPLIGRSSTASSRTTEFQEGDVLADEADKLEGMHAQQALETLGERLTWDTCHVGALECGCVPMAHDRKQDEQMAIFATATTAMTYVVVGIQEVQRKIVALVGETKASGISQAQERWSHMAVEV